MTNQPGNQGAYGYPPPPPPHPSQPRWAWWVVGIAIPLIGIFVTIAVSGSDSDSNSKNSSTSTSTTAGTQAQQNPPESGRSASSPPGPGGQTTGGRPSGGQPPPVLFGPGTVTVDPSSRYVDLDTKPPLVGPSNKAADIVFLYTFAKPELVTVGSTPTLAALPQGGSEPTAASCAEAVAKRGTYLAGELAQGSGFCAITNEGRTAYFRLIGPPAGEAPVRLEVTVWDIPGS
ncbi:hypothetical protein ACIBSV_09375 [Embleya sp. NPDC050154]|uniref:hypothetical protein n=1 Tax=Embleya sp. NPDC050154 TaxID=3363988 RepID=UPI00378C186C